MDHKFDRFGVAALLFCIILVICVVTISVLVTLQNVSHHANMLDDLRSRETTAGAIKTFRVQLAATLNDYAAWDDAAQFVYDKNSMEWTISNYGDMTVNSALFDVAIVVDARRRMLMAYQNGYPLRLPIDLYFDSALWTLFEEAKSATGKQNPEASGFVHTRDGIAAIGVALIRNKSGTLDQPADKQRFLIFARHLSDDKVQKLAETYVIEGLQLVAKDDPSPNTVAIVDPVGATLGKLSWPSRLPGDASYRRAWPTVIMSIVLFALLIGLLLITGVMVFRRLRAREQHARKEAMTDRLSGLRNRAGIKVDIDALVEGARATGRDVIVYYLDLDGFKSVNDTYGHEIGDRLIQGVSAGLVCLAPEGAMVARLGGDEFAIAFQSTAASAIQDDFSALVLEFFSGAFDIAGRSLGVGVSIGISTSVSGQLDCEELVRRADIAMYRAKESGRGRAFAFDPSMDEDRETRKHLELDLGKAIENDELDVVFQPVVNASTLRLTSVEALVRWDRSGTGTVPPDIFIPVAEKCGLIEALGAFVLRTACRQARRWDDIDIAVNISPVQLRNPGFPDTVRSIIEETGIPASRLTLEMTEGCLIQNPAQIRLVLGRLKAVGVKIALDDFGAGFASIGYLRQFGFDRLKIDRSLVNDVDETENARNLMQATVALARSLDIPVTAEGVEREAQAVILRLCGCDEFQGYLYGQPAAAGSIEQMLAIGRPTTATAA